jgi:hypothetical protein
MPDQPPSDRFKADMPQIPGVSSVGTPSPPSDSSLKLGIGLLVVLLAVFLGARWALHPKDPEPRVADQPQIEVPTPAPDPSNLLPHATGASPGIANIEEMAKPWSFKQFFIRNELSGENVPAMLIRLPTGSASQASGYWAFSVNAPYGDCRLEYVTELAKLETDYGFSAAKHPMVGNPCSRTLFDPLKMTNLPGDFFVRGGIVQGSDLRPPLGVEIRIRGKNILAIRTE